MVLVVCAHIWVVLGVEWVWAVDATLMLVVSPVQECYPEANQPGHQGSMLGFCRFASTKRWQAQ